MAGTRKRHSAAFRYHDEDRPHPSLSDRTPGQVDRTGAEGLLSGGPKKSRPPNRPVLVLESTRVGGGRPGGGASFQAEKCVPKAAEAGVGFLSSLVLIECVELTPA
jgi:hypothetical protein